MRTRQQISADIENSANDVGKLSDLYKEIEENKHLYSYTDVWFWKQRLLRIRRDQAESFPDVFEDDV